jgi:biotin operon repressor
VSAEVTKHQLLAVLQRHVGAEQGVGAAALAALLGTNKREVRHLVTELRMDGVAVCGHPRTGYFIARTPEELEQTCRFLRDRAMSSLVLESKLRGLPLADLLGQLRLPT